MGWVVVGSENGLSDEPMVAKRMEAMGSSWMVGDACLENVCN
jgi:hypothetical protein